MNRASILSPAKRERKKKKKWTGTRDKKTKGEKQKRKQMIKKKMKTKTKVIKRMKRKDNKTIPTLEERKKSKNRHVSYTLTVSIITNKHTNINKLYKPINWINYHYRTNTNTKIQKIKHFPAKVALGNMINSTTISLHKQSQMVKKIDKNIIIYYICLLIQTAMQGGLF